MTQNRELEIHDALERLTYAHLQQDPESVARAEWKLRSALSVPSPVSAKRARQMLVEIDPISAVSMGILSVSAARRKIRQSPNDFLEEDEVTAFKRDSSVLRYIVQAREAGSTLSDFLLEIDQKLPKRTSAVNKRKKAGETRSRRAAMLRKKRLAKRLITSRR